MTANQAHASNHIPAVLSTLGRNAARVRPGTVNEMRVAHDDWCGIFQGRVCNCNPVTELIEIEPKGIVSASP
jgi:hypothetical protein